MRYTILGIVLAAVALGCSRRTPPAGNVSPFEEDPAGYTLAFVFDLGPKYRDRVIGPDPIALRYALEVKDLYFRDRSEPTDRLVIAQVSGQEKAVLWDGRPRTFKREFPDPAEDFKNYVSARAAGGEVHAYDAVADTFDYLVKFRSRGKMAVLVFSEMHDRSPDPAKSRKHLVDSLGAYARTGGHSAFYWLSFESCKELEAIAREAGLTMGQFVPDPVRDPVRPSFLD